ncbi:glycerophosphodiester phosphodiesterase [Trujillonella endophytica]|uniref:Glycerophosphoryl diester phosphodiesterase family protein n=1 Tax=Trujillonella endophytica TaxID=673521 RepID=A0A1H8RZU2_9ACTN|nr:glycerophosphodiester phosphodiesterase [Trujillella endophytica]SEO71885.1 Glycerophosphoryl diester phosphodiesterase family protein [Trujillella endophytica]
MSRGRTGPAGPATPADLSLVSAHRGGAGRDVARENTLEALRDAARFPCEYVEFDVQRCADGVYVVHHDRHVRSGDRRVPISSLTFGEFTRHAGSYLLLDDALNELRGRKKAHLDCKLVYDTGHGGALPAGSDVLLVRHVVHRMGAENVVVTGLSDAAVRAVRAWSREHCPELRVGLSLSRDVGVRGLVKLVTGRLDEVLPGRRLRASDANLAVCKRTQARLWGARWARRYGLPLLVWTVDDPDQLRAWLRDERAWMVTTNFPLRAVELRRELAATGA